MACKIIYKGVSYDESDFKSQIEKYIAINNLFDENETLANAVYETLGSNLLKEKQNSGLITFEDLSPALLEEYKNELQEYQISLAEAEIELLEIKKREVEFKKYFLNKINNKVDFPVIDITKYEPYKKAKYIIESSQNTKNKYKKDLEAINNELNKVDILNKEGDLIYDENKKITIKLTGFGLPEYVTKTHKQWLEEIENINEEIKGLSLKIINNKDRLQNAEIDFYTKESDNRKDFEIPPQQKQHAQQLYSEYLDTIFPDSKVEEIDNSLYISVLEDLKSNKIIEKQCS